MKTKFLKNALLAGVILSASIVGTAQADTLATAIVDVTNLTFSQGGTILDASDFTSINYTNSADVTVHLGAASATDSGNVVGLDLYEALGSATPYTDNAFTSTILSSGGGYPTGVNYSIADQLEAGAPISGLPDGSGGTISSPAHVANASQAGISGTTTGSSDSNNQLDAQFVFSGVSGVMQISFDMAYYLEVFVDLAQGFPSKAAADYVFTMDITSLQGADAGATLFEFTLADGLSLTAPTIIDTRLGDDLDNGGFLTLGVADSLTALFNTGPFLEGSVYQLDTRIETNADVVNIPEPGMLALLGLGLVGIGFTRRRAK